MVDAVRSKSVSVNGLRQCLGGLVDRRHRGRRAIERLLDLWGAGAPPESVLEDGLLRILHSARLPTPVAQFEVALGGGAKARIDFAYPEQMIAIEADGYRWHGDPKSWRSDLVRRNELTRLGWRTLHFTWHDVRSRPDHIVATLRSALDLRSHTPG